ncbi:hypothetical protein PISMIDRAFT_684162, partial [Pisolithus microcarpus 441]
CTRGNLSPQDIRQPSTSWSGSTRLPGGDPRYPSIPLLTPFFSAGNVEGLLSRLELWEKMVRSPRT